MRWREAARRSSTSLTRRGRRRAGPSNRILTRSNGANEEDGNLWVFSLSSVGSVAPFEDPVAPFRSGPRSPPLRLLRQGAEELGALARGGSALQVVDRPRQAPGPVASLMSAGVLMRSRQPKMSWIGTSTMSDADDEEQRRRIASRMASSNGAPGRGRARSPEDRGERRGARRAAPRPTTPPVGLGVVRAARRDRRTRGYVRGSLNGWPSCSHSRSQRSTLKPGMPRRVSVSRTKAGMTPRSSAMSRAPGALSTSSTCSPWRDLVRLVRRHERAVPSRSRA